MSADGRQSPRLELLSNWLNRYRPNMLVAAAPFAGGGTEADDIVQQASLEALSRLEDVTTIEAPAAWLMAITRHVGLRVHCKRKRRVSLWREWTRKESLGRRPSEVCLSWSADGDASRRKRVIEAAQQLTDPLREVVEAMLDDLTDSEIAVHCGVSVSTVRVRRYRAILAVREILCLGGTV